jgi:HlyD family secretion protein
VDRPLANSYRRRRLLRRVLTGVLAVALLILAARLISGLIRPSVRRSTVRTAVVERGPIEATISARGNVVPEHEQIITSPIDTRVTRIWKSPGEEIAAGEAIVRLDVNESELALEKLKDQIELKRNERRRAQLGLESTLSELRGQKAIKELELKSYELTARRDRQLADRGVISEDEARKSETDAERARIELEQLGESMQNARHDLAAQLDGLDLEISILEKDHDEASHQLELATATSDRHGVLTWVLPSEGMAVRRGDEVARIADLSSFRVDASVSDVHASRLATGQPAIVRSGETELAGLVSNILPTVENGVVTFEVTLDDKNQPLLRHNLRVDVYVVTEHKEDTIRIRRGAYVRADGSNAVFVIQGERAIRTPVRFGITNFETYEVLAGLTPGNEVIISDMSDYMHVKEVKLR